MNRTALTVTGIALVVSVLIDALVGYSRFPGYGALIGLGGCIVLVYVSKWLGAFLQRPEDYWDEGTPDVQEDVRGR